MRRAITLSILCLFPLQAYSFNFGVRAGIGLNLPNYEDATTPTTDISKTSFQGGAFASLDLAGLTFQLQPEVNYVRKEAGIEAASFTSVVKLDFIEVPLLLRFNFAEDASGLFVLGGPRFDFLMSESHSTNGGPYVSNTSMKKFDIGILGGLGYQFAFGLFTDVRYGAGFQSLADISGFSYKQQTVYFSFGYRF